MKVNLEKLAHCTAHLNEQLLEDTLYEVALTELQNDAPEHITMARALAAADGDTKQAALQYPQLRVVRLRAELKQYKKDAKFKTIERSVKRIGFEIGDLVKDVFDFIDPTTDSLKNKKTSFDKAFLWDDD